MHITLTKRLAPGIKDTESLGTDTTRVAESEVQHPTPTFPESPTPHKVNEVRMLAIL